jgi:hypothetical protein
MMELLFKPLPGTPYRADIMLVWSKVHIANGVAGVLRVAGFGIPLLVKSAVSSHG